MNYYNENDNFAAKWLRELIKEKLIPDGEVDERSIADVEPQDLDGFNQHHFFAGIGGWPYALRLSRWNANRPVWTGSCPCQPLSVAGKRLGEKDDRHLWPVWYKLISKLRPATIFGEQVASKDGREWLAGVRLDLEALGYAVGGADLPAASVGAPHKRNRLFWVGQSNGAGSFKGKQAAKRSRYGHTTKPTGNRSMAESESVRLQESGQIKGRSLEAPSRNGGVAHPKRNGGRSNEPRREAQKRASNFWHSSVFIQCADGKSRRVPGRVDIPTSNGQHTQEQGELRQDKHKAQAGQNNVEQISGHTSFGMGGSEEHQHEIEPALFPLADGFSNRVGELRGAGNAIVPQVAAEFIKAAF